MANTIPDIRLTRTAYVDAYAATGIAKGTPITIQNKSTTGIYIQIKATQPAANSADGWLLMANDDCLVEGGTISGVWIIGAGAVSVQIFD